MSRECGEQLPSKYDGQEVPDHSNDHFNGDRPECEDPKYEPTDDQVQVICELNLLNDHKKTCPKCRMPMEAGEFQSMGPGYSEYEHFSQGMLVWQCPKCFHTEEVEHEPSFEDYSNMEQDGHPGGYNICGCGEMATHNHNHLPCCGGMMCCPEANE